jgi:protein TonB
VLYGNATQLHLTITGAGFENNSSSSKPTIMQPEIILESDVLDILFENRNKEYGAYTLRREYDARMGKAIVITFSLVALLLLLVFGFRQKNNHIHIASIPDIFTLKPPPSQEKKKAEPPQKQENSLPKKALKNKATILLPMKPTIMRDKLADTNIPTIDETLKENIADKKMDAPENIAQQNIIADSSSSSDGKKSGTGITTGAVAISTPINNPDVYPEFPGGKDALLRFLKKNLNSNMENDYAVSVRIRFVVNADGSIAGFNVVESGSDEFDNEVLRVLKKMPRWIPGKSSGQDVSVYYEIPVKFITNDD